MNILPKHYSQFKQKEYWNSFFSKLKQTQNQHFQWYGTFQDYRNTLFLVFNQLYNLNNKSKTFNIAHLGCGKSTFGQDIAKGYPIFDNTVWNVDYSQQIISEMETRRKLLKLSDKIMYEVCDLLQPVGAEHQNKFNVIVDKGTLDAMLPEDEQANIKQIKQAYFHNIQLLLKKDSFGSYVIISMLQEFILRTLLQYFIKLHHFSIKIYECSIPNSQIQPFLIDIRYSPQVCQPRSVQVQLLNKTELTFSQISQIMAKIKQLQQLASFTKNVKSLSKGQLAKFNIFTKQQTVRYMIDIADHSNPQILLKNNCGVLIVPQGQQNMFLFSSQEGIKNLVEQVGFARLIVVKLVSGQTFTDLNILPSIIPKNCDSSTVPYMTNGDIGTRKYLFQNQQIFIQQVLIKGEGFRRLILRNNLAVVQSQFKLGYLSEKNNKQLLQIQTGILPAKKTMVVGIDKQYLDDSYCRVIVAGMANLIEKELKLCKVLHLGGGGCAISKYLYHTFDGITQTIVQSCKSVVETGYKYFEWPVNNHKFEVVLDDALSYVKTAEKQSKFDCIVVDISSDESQFFFPPKQFSSPEFLHGAINLLQKDGAIIFNTLKLAEQKNMNQTQPNFTKLLNQFKQISTIYKSKQGENTIYIGLTKELPIIEQNGIRTINIINHLKTAKKLYTEWETPCNELLQIVQPVVRHKYKDSDISVVSKNQQKKKKKKK